MIFIFLIGLLVAALAGTCWYAVDSGRSALASQAKVGTLLALIVLALLLGASGAPGGPALLVGLFFSLAGDLALLRRDATGFAVGLGAFLLAHVAYVWAFSTHWFSPAGAVVALLLVLPFAVLSGSRVQRRTVAMGGQAWGRAVVGYAIVLGAMALAAGATGNPLVLTGAVLFLLSDTVLALDRFDAPRIRAPLVVMALYHLAQVSIVLGLLIRASG